MGTNAFDAVRLSDLVEIWGLVKYENCEQQRLEAAAAASLARLRVGGVQALLRALVVLYCLTQPLAGKKTKPDLEVTFA